MERGRGRIARMGRGAETRVASFWWLQTGGWSIFCLLSLLFVLPYVREPGELGYRGLPELMADQAVMCLGVFLASVALRPVCRSLANRQLPWIGTEVRALGWSLAIGIAATFAAVAFLREKPDPVEFLDACVKMAVLLFLWCNLYFGVKRTRLHEQDETGQPQIDSTGINESNCEPTTRFLVRTGQRLLIVPAEDVMWISAAGDYVELHTRTATHLLRNTMNSLERRLEQGSFARIHRSRIVNLNRIQELRSIENHEYVVKLTDGTQHRSSRTYADKLERWLNEDRLGK